MAIGVGLTALLVLIVLRWYASEVDSGSYQGQEPRATGSGDRAPGHAASPGEKRVIIPDGPENEGVAPERVIAETKVKFLASRAVQDRCSQFAAFREGMVIKSDFQRRDDRVFSNVSIELMGHDQASLGILGYVVLFEGDRPVAFKATGEIAAKLCGLPGADVAARL